MPGVDVPSVGKLTSISPFRLRDARFVRVGATGGRTRRVRWRRRNADTTYIRPHSWPLCSSSTNKPFSARKPLSCALARSITLCSTAVWFRERFAREGLGRFSSFPRIQKHLQDKLPRDGDAARLPVKYTVERTIRSASRGSSRRRQVFRLLLPSFHFSSSSRKQLNIS